jgi:4-oxalocrotonate tautomerase
MPYVKIELTREGVTREQKQELISGITNLITEVLNKDPHLTHVNSGNRIGRLGLRRRTSISIKRKGITADKK